MAEKTKYLSRIKKKGAEILLKDREAREQLLLPVDVSTITPTTVYPARSLMGLGGVLYVAKRQTQQPPLQIVVSDGKFVVHEVSGQQQFVVTSYTHNSDWEALTDISMTAAVTAMQADLETAIAQAKTDLQTAIDQKLSLAQTVTLNGKVYTVEELLAGIAALMGKTVVVSSN